MDLNHRLSFENLRHEDSSLCRYLRSASWVRCLSGGGGEGQEEEKEAWTCNSEDFTQFLIMTNRIVLNQRLYCTALEHKYLFLKNIILKIPPLFACTAIWSHSISIIKLAPSSVTFYSPGMDCNLYIQFFFSFFAGGRE